MKEKADMLGKSLGDTASKTDTFTNKVGSSIGKVTQMATALGLVKVASAAFKVLANSLDSAISRFDTMQKFPKVMNALGFSAKESQNLLINYPMGSTVFLLSLMTLLQARSK